MALAAPAPEYAVQRVNRLAEELAFEMDAWMQDMRDSGSRTPLWEARIWPASSGRGIYFQNHSMPPLTPEERVARAQKELIEATKALHPEVTDWRVIRDEDEPDGGNTVGLFMVLGHRARKAVRA